MMIGNDGAEIRNQNKEKEKNISFIEETSAQDEPNTPSETEDSANEAEIYATEMVKMYQPYKCTLLKPQKLATPKLESQHIFILLMLQKSI